MAFSFIYAVFCFSRENSKPINGIFCWEMEHCIYVQKKLYVLLSIQFYVLKLMFCHPYDFALMYFVADAFCHWCVSSPKCFVANAFCYRYVLALICFVHVPKLGPKEHKFFFLYIFFLANQRSIFHNFFPLLPLTEVSPQPSAIPDGNPPRDSQSAVGWGDAGFEPGTAGQQSGALPLSHHASQHYHQKLEVFWTMEGLV
jgi:hypothetical protein